MGGPSAPQQESSMQQAQSQLMLDEAKYGREQQQAALLKQQEEAAQAALVNKLAPKHSQAYGQATSYYDTQLAARGIDQSIAGMYGMDDLYYSNIDAARTGIEDTNSNPFASYDVKGNFRDALDTGLGSYRSDLKNKLHGVAGDGFEYGAFSDTADDDIISSILGTQQEDARVQIENAHKRGQLNDVGYKRALSGLDDQMISATGQLNDIGGGVLAGYRSNLTNLRDSSMDRIDTLDFSSPMNFDSINSRMGNMTNDYNAQMRGDLLAAAGDTSYFDPATLISKGGTIQGFYNPSSTTGVSDPLVDNEDETLNQNVLF